LPPKRHFLVRQTVQISSKMLPQIQNFASFSPSEYETMSEALLLLTYSMKSCDNSLRHLACTFLKEKKSRYCWILDILDSCSFCLESV